MRKSNSSVGGRRLPLPNEQALDLIFQRYDAGNHQHLDYPEIKKLLTDVFAVLGRKGRPTSDDIRDFVSVTDLNGNGLVTRANLARVFSEVCRMTHPRK